MRNFLRIVTIVSIILSFSVINAIAQEDINRVRKIVIFKEGLVDIPAQSALLKSFGGEVTKHLRLVGGMAVSLPPHAEKALLRRSGVLRVDDDLVIEAIARVSRVKPQPPQEVPWGIKKILADLAWATSTGNGIKVAVVDTGIDLDHPDLTAHIKGQVNTINPLRTGDDDNGHGTHVAGTIAALNNSIGVVGVGPNISLYAVKVLGRNGSGYLSDVIEGLDWCINNPNKTQVINMSLGSSTGNQTFRDAIIRVHAAGIIQVAAAGNSGGAVIFPAAYPEVIAVSAIDSNNIIASWSSRGSEVDLAAPGVNIKSTYNNGYYQTLSGTSMASPHVAGTAALVLATPVSVYDSNNNGVWDPAEVQAKLEETAQDLGVAGKDSLYGSGLVDADRATR